MHLIVHFNHIASTKEHSNTDSNIPVTQWLKTDCHICHRLAVTNRSLRCACEQRRTDVEGALYRVSFCRTRFALE